MLSTSQLGVVALLVVILFGTKRLPELGSGLGKAISNFKRTFKEESDASACSVEDKVSGSAKE